MTKLYNISIEEIREKLINWFELYKRPLPWRENRSWYSVWISEVMLQQTQVEKVIPYYNRFLKKYPTLKHLVSTDLQSVLKLWEGLGYYTRAHNLFESAQIIFKKYGGILPESEEHIRKLPGFGPYTTNAVLSIAYNKPLAVVDGNVIRVITRMFKINADIRSVHVGKKIQEYMNRLLDPEFPGQFNEAVMELGATLCLPLSPKCALCPLNLYCRAFHSGTIFKLPYKSQSAPKKVVNSIALVCIRNDKLLIAQRPDSGLLGGFWEFPNYVIPNGGSIESVRDREIMQEMNPEAKYVLSIQPIKHIYTHFRLNLYGRVYLFNQNTFSSAFYQKHKWIKFEEFIHYPLHRAMTKMLDRVKTISEIVTKG